MNTHHDQHQHQPGETRRPARCIPDPRHRDKPAHVRRQYPRLLDNQHADACRHPDRCPGCVECPEHHCAIDGRRHLDPDDRAHPLTCPDCLGKVRKDLDDIRWLCRHLRWQASRGENYRTAAAPIPGGDAMTLLGPHARHADAVDPDPKLHRATDPRPPLEVLLTWDHQVRTWLQHTLPTRPTITGTTRYLTGHLGRWAQDTTGTAPDWPAFATEAGDLRRLLERVLHDEQTPELGVACFECGDRLVRRWNDRQPCGHCTPARDLVRVWDRVLGYPEALTAADRLAATLPCGACDQGGIADPSAGQSWECPGCRKEYSPGEYASAVRRDLLQRGPAGDGWTHVNMAAEAASTLTGYVVPPATVRKWMDRTRVASVCRWTPGEGWGLRLVFWPDVADAAVEAVQRQQELQRRRRERAELEARLRRLVEGGMELEVAAGRLGMTAKRARLVAASWSGDAAGAA